MAAYDHIDFAPPQGAREAARRALEVRAEKPESQRGMTPVGIARARDLANGRRLSPQTVRRMKEFFDRHEIDKQGETWAEQGKGWQAWHGWGGDPGYAWARKIVRQLDAADRAREMGDAPAPSQTVAVVLPLDEELGEYVALPGASRRSPAHVTLCILDAAAVEGARVVLAAAVGAWAQGCPALPARLSGVLRFAGETSDAFALTVDAVGLSAARERLVGFLRAAGFEPVATHGFTPHVTLDYLPREAPSPALPYELPLDTTFDAAALWLGEDRGARFPLAGADAPSALSERPAMDTPETPDVTRDDDAESVRGATESITCRDAAVGSKTWNQIARYGTFRAHPQGGFSFGPEQFAEIVRNFRATKNRAVPVDYEHASERHPENVGQKGVPALAWIIDIEDRGEDGLWAHFDWKDPEAVEHVRAERYRYLSPAVNFQARDKETGRAIGARLTSCALTNQPFLDGMAPVTASEASTRMSLAPGDVHVPTTPGATPSPKSTHMEIDKKDDAAREMEELKARYTRAMADIEASSAKVTEASAAQAKMGEKLMAMRGRLCSLAGIEDAEGAEDLALEKLQGIIDHLREVQKAEAEELAKKTASAHGLSDTPASIERLTSMILSDRAGFEVMFPKAAPKAPAAPPSPPAANLLTTRVAGADKLPSRPVTMSDATTPADRSRRVNERADALLRDGKARSQSEALLMADRELSMTAARDAVAPFAG